ncbi:ejaculatory bulb-specific protein 3-like [Arctopsyche grandis]|uniref:ejaculatory bulb-specific protein 3-like n=1 Tax=Arctopsyche grandis TaxID=121162 RepID=UPI00406D7B51
MRIFVFLLMTLSLVLAAKEKYTTKYDNVDVDRILANDRILNNYIKCMLDEGPCTAEGRELKKTLPDALANGCNKCNERQRSTTEKVFKHLTTKRPRDWDRLSKKFDPQGNYKKKYEEKFGRTI